MSKFAQPKTYSTDPDALKQANPRDLTEAQRNYRSMLLEKDVARIKRSGQSQTYLAELSLLLMDEPEKAADVDVSEATTPIKSEADAFHE